jgi:hypothetical protein
MEAPEVPEDAHAADVKLEALQVAALAQHFRRQHL